MLRFALYIWFALFSCLSAAAIADNLFDLGWGFARDEVWAFGGFILFGGFFWLFARALMALTLSISRRMYGSEPDDPPV